MGFLSTNIDLYNHDKVEHEQKKFSPKMLTDDVLNNWRRVRDSNPRYSCPYTSLAGRRFRPLSQLSDFLDRNYNALKQENNTIYRILFASQKAGSRLPFHP